MKSVYAKIDPGAYDQVFTFQIRPTTKSASGADVRGAPVEIGRVRGSVKRVMGGAAPSDVLTRTKYEFETYYIAGITKLVEIAWEGRILAILEVPDLGPRPRNLIIIAQERA